MHFIQVLPVLAQDALSFSEFLSKFQKENLPLCIEYSQEERAYFDPPIISDDSVLVEDEDTSFYEYEIEWAERGDYIRGDDDVLPIENIKKILLPAGEFIHFYDDSGSILFSEPLEEYLEPSEFYPIALLAKTPKFNVVVYERIYNISYLSSEKFLCTFSKEGKFISRVLIASCAHSGSYTHDSGGRFPWYPEESGCVDKELNITFTNYQEEIKKYKIDADGVIKLAK